MTQKKAILKVLELLKEADFSGKEITSRLGGSYGSVRTILSFLSQLGFVKSVPEEKRGKPFRLTKMGEEYLEKMSEKNE